MNEKIDLRSDTVTHPTTEMRQSMMEAIVGDDGYGDDPTMNELEAYCAKLMGKEAAVFVASGAMGNQLALFTHCDRGDEVILPRACHIVEHECGGPAVIAGVNTKTLEAPHGIYELEELKNAINPVGAWPKTSLVCVENPFSSGVVQPLAYLEQVQKIAHKGGAKVHLDGARIFNGATHLGVEPKEIAKYADSVMFCLSKGLCAPVGSVLVGDAQWIAFARRKRRVMGGELRQSGVLAAPGLIAVKEMPKRLKEDHETAMQLAKGLSAIPGVEIDMEKVHINMVYADIRKTGVENDDFYSEMTKKGVVMNNSTGVLRFVTHHGIVKADIERVIQIAKEILE